MAASNVQSKNKIKIHGIRLCLKNSLNWWLKQKDYDDDNNLIIWKLRSLLEGITTVISSLSYMIDCIMAAILEKQLKEIWIFLQVAYWIVYSVYSLAGKKHCVTTQITAKKNTTFWIVTSNTDLNVFSPSCDSKCLFKWTALTNDFSHPSWGHTQGLWK